MTELEITTALNYFNALNEAVFILFGWNVINTLLIIYIFPKK